MNRDENRARGAATTAEREPRSEAGKGGRALHWLIGSQLAALAIALVVPFGFDKPTELGLHSGHLAVLAAIYAVLLLAGLFAAGRGRQWTALWLQIGLAAGLGALLASGQLAI